MCRGLCGLRQAATADHALHAHLHGCGTAAHLLLHSMRTCTPLKSLSATCACDNAGKPGSWQTAKWCSRCWAARVAPEKARKRSQTSRGTPRSASQSRLCGQRMGSCRYGFEPCCVHVPAAPSGCASCALGMCCCLAVFRAVHAALRKWIAVLSGGTLHSARGCALLSCKTLCSRLDTDVQNYLATEKSGMQHSTTSVIVHIIVCMEMQGNMNVCRFGRCRASRSS